MSEAISDAEQKWRDKEYADYLKRGAKRLARPLLG